MILQVPKPLTATKSDIQRWAEHNSIFKTCTYHSPISITSISSQSSVGSGKSRRFFRLKFNLPVSSASLKHLSSGMPPDMVGFTCYKEDIGTFTRLFFLRCGDILDVFHLPRVVTTHDSGTAPRGLCGKQATQENPNNSDWILNGVN